MITWNVNKSSEQYDFLSDVAKVQANVAMCQETQNWHPDGTAEDLGWTLLKEEKEGKAAIAVKRQNMSLLRHSSASKRRVLVVLVSILFLSIYLPHTWSGEANLEEYYNTLQGLDEHARSQAEVPDLRHHCWNGCASGGEAEPGQFVGGGTRMFRGITAKYYELESKCESLLMEWVTKHDVKLGNTSCRSWEPTRAKTNKLDFRKQEEGQLQKWTIIDHVAVPIQWWTRSAVARGCRAQNLTDHWPLLTQVRLPQKRESWKNQNSSTLTGWRPKTESDEAGFGGIIAQELEEAQDLIGEVSIEDITKNLPKAAKAVEFESRGGRNKMVRKTQEHLEAEKNLKGKEGEELKISEQRRKYKNLAGGTEGQKQAKCLPLGVL